MTERPVTIGDLRRDGLRLHVFCQGCGWEREVRLDAPPFDRLPDEQPVPTACRRLKCSDCGERDKIWTAPENPGASDECRLRWGWTEEEIEAAHQRREAMGKRQWAVGSVRA